jgi:hypothetical protein
MSGLVARYAFYTCGREGPSISSLRGARREGHHMSKFPPYLLIAIISLYLAYEYLR